MRNDADRPDLLLNGQRGQLTAELSLAAKAHAAEEVSAVVVLRNNGDTALRIDLWPLRSPSLTLEILDATDQPVRLPPPPVPGGRTEPLVLDPGAETRLEYAMFLPPWIERGYYRVRFRFTHEPIEAGADSWTGRIESAWQALEIGN